MTSNCQEVQVRDQFFPPGLERVAYMFSEKKLRKLFDTNDDGIKHYYLGSLYPGIYLTPQEARCMFYFLQNLTNQQVGKYLSLSDRTVGSYASNMQRKLKLKNKKEMAQVVKQTDFLKYFSDEQLFSGEL